MGEVTKTPRVLREALCVLDNLASVISFQALTPRGWRRRGWWSWSCRSRTVSYWAVFYVSLGNVSRDEKQQLMVFSKILLANWGGAPWAEESWLGEWLSRIQRPTLFVSDLGTFACQPANGAFQISGAAGEEGLQVAFFLSKIATDAHSMSTDQSRE